ncbi:MAG: DUF2934 domain-containing protein [Gemmatimonadota bacterium]|nr:DUF2934 domain-containing protein [Gemmatimonadota bacterium]
MSSPRRKRSGSDLPVDREGGLNADTSAAEQNQGALGDDEQIRARAYELYLERGGGPSDEMEDWLRAEREYHELGPAEEETPPPAA